MKLGIDASRAFGEERTGTEEYSYQIIKHLAKLKIDGQVVLYLKKKDLKNIDFDLPDNFKLKIISLPKFWTQIGLASEMMINKPDILFIPSYAVPQIHPRKTIVTIHGLEYRHFPECYSFKERFILELNTQFSIKWASKIIVPSENTKRDLVEFYGVDTGKIKVVYHGVGIANCELRIANKDKEKKSPLLGGSWGWVSSAKKPTSNPSQDGTNKILFIGRLEKRKNLVNLIKAFDLFKKDLKNPPSPLLQRGKMLISPFVKGGLRGFSDIKLILAGKTGFGFEEIKKAIKKSPFKKDIILKGYVSEKEKSELYKNADLFILPSFYEGFGLPVLEAMSYGVPVICSNTSSLPEVAGDAALPVNPNNSKEIAAAMNKVFSDDSFKNKMIEKGFENVKKFSWEKCARETIKEVSSL